MSALLDPEDLAMAGWLAIIRAGHWDCGAWSVDSRDQVLECTCGTRLHRLEAVA